MKIFVTGIGTGVGKTIVSAILCEAFGADYWKPVQCGNLDESDTLFIKSVVVNSSCRFHPETYKFQLPASPHTAAADEGKTIELSRLHFPATTNHLVIEGAGGLLVPLNKNHLMADFISLLQIPVVVVSRHYLGSINHTLLTLDVLRMRSIPVLGVIFNGNEDPWTESAILEHGKIQFLARVRETALEINQKFIQENARDFKWRMGEFFK